MNTDTLKLLASRVRLLMAESHKPMGHNQSLDLVAALVGLENWPEVRAFPSRVAECELDLASARRLAARLLSKFEHEVSPSILLACLNSPGIGMQVDPLQIWPTGPEPGVYVTASRPAIDALLRRHAESTGGALVYSVGAKWDGSVELGEGGFLSHGLDLLPSGTLFVVGPLVLSQRTWFDSFLQLELSAMYALASRRRVAVLVETPQPDAVAEDVMLCLRQSDDEGMHCSAALRGVVTERGELQARVPFQRLRCAPRSEPTIATLDAIPPHARPALRNALNSRSSGVVLFGSPHFDAKRIAFELAAASLAMTEHLGPAAWILPEGPWSPVMGLDFPEAIDQLPVLPSIESAHAQGYRRMVVDPGFTHAGSILQVADDVLLLVPVTGESPDEAYWSFLRPPSSERYGELFASIIAILCVRTGPAGDASPDACSFFLKPDHAVDQPQSLAEIYALLRADPTMDDQLRMPS